MKILLTIVLILIIGFILMRIYARTGTLLQSYPPGAKPGITNGQLAPCKTSPNCVSSFSNPTDKEHFAEVIIVPDSVDNPKKRLIEIINAMPGAQLVEDVDHYIRAEYTTKLMRYVDDVEFVIDANNRKIDFRSASRVGHSDMGLNRKRIEEIRTLLHAQ